MCGIAGILDLSGQRPDRSLLEITVSKMANSLSHRGPDDAGAWSDPNSGIALGHRRLAVQDLSSLGHQPMHSEDGRYAISFNGEVYNFKALRLELEGNGHRFRGRSDTEVMLAAFVQWGVAEAVRRFNGAFAFALWDSQLRVLHLVRDRLGEKPLYYGWMGNVLLFGSELKALRLHPSFDASLDRDSLALFLRHNFIPAPYSIYKGVRKLLPGTILTIRCGQPFDARAECYWSARQVVESGVSRRFPGSFEEASEITRGLLSESVALRTAADVPVGALLSGGIDSSLIVALMQAEKAQAVKTFTIGFHEPDYDESQYARSVAEHLGTDHTELHVSADQAMAVVPRLPALYDEPFADPSQIPTYLLAALARSSVSVTLSGDGGDEIFGGYDHYFAAADIWAKWNALTPQQRAGIADGVSRAAAGPADDRFQWHEIRGPKGFRLVVLGQKLKRLAASLPNLRPESLYADLKSWRQADSLAGESNELSIPLTNSAHWASVTDMYEHMMYLDSVLYLPDYFLTKVDRASMGVGLEVRPPFLDHRVYELAWELPLPMKIQEWRGKVILCHILQRYLPPSLMDRPKKGFDIPLGSWLRGSLRRWAEDLLEAAGLKQDGVLDAQVVRGIWTRHLSASHDRYSRALWAVLMFQAWLHAR